MKIIIRDLNGSIEATVLFSSHERCDLEGKVVGSLTIPNKEDLSRVVSVLCDLTDGVDGSFQHGFEKMLVKVFQLGVKYGKQ